MPSETKCNVREDLVNQLIALNNKLNTLSPTFVHSSEERAEVQERREILHIDLKRHKMKGHEGKACPAAVAQRLPYRSNAK